MPLHDMTAGYLIPERRYESAQNTLANLEEQESRQPITVPLNSKFIIDDIHFGRTTRHDETDWYSLGLNSIPGYSVVADDRINPTGYERRNHLPDSQFSPIDTRNAIRRIGGFVLAYNYKNDGILTLGLDHRTVGCNDISDPFFEIDIAHDEQEIPAQWQTHLVLPLRHSSFNYSGHYSTEDKEMISHDRLEIPIAKTIRVAESYTLFTSVSNRVADINLMLLGMNGLIDVMENREIQQPPLGSFTWSAELKQSVSKFIERIGDFSRQATINDTSQPTTR